MNPGTSMRIREIPEVVNKREIHALGAGAPVCPAGAAAAGRSPYPFPLPGKLRKRAYSTILLKA